MDRMTDVSKNITLPQTSFAGGNKSVGVIQCRIQMNFLRTDLG